MGLALAHPNYKQADRFEDSVEGTGTRMHVCSRSIEDQVTPGLASYSEKIGEHEDVRHVYSRPTPASVAVEDGWARFMVNRFEHAQTIKMVLYSEPTCSYSIYRKWLFTKWGPMIEIW
jgi:hypothetical protein